MVRSSVRQSVLGNLDPLAQIHIDQNRTRIGQLFQRAFRHPRDFGIQIFPIGRAPRDQAKVERS